MLLDKYLKYKHKVFLSVVCTGFWIYFRTSDCYNMIPRHHIFPVIFVMGWTYLNYYEPLFLPIGLSILIAYSKLNWIIDITDADNNDKTSDDRHTVSYNTNTRL